MYRLIVALLCSATLAAIVVAAPAPFARRATAWLDGWDRPVDPRGGCRFDRRGGVLTVTVPGDLYHLDDGLNAPRLLRDVEGDFVVQVRVSGDFRPDVVDQNWPERAAGLCITDGETLLCLERIAMDRPFLLGFSRGHAVKGPPSAWLVRRSFDKGPHLWKPAYLRLERRGDLLSAASSPDGEGWKSYGHPANVVGLRQGRLKVGVVAESRAGNFVAVFDRFTLTPLARQYFQAEHLPRPIKVW